MSPHHFSRYVAILNLLRGKSLPGAPVYRGLLTQPNSPGRIPQFTTADTLKAARKVPTSLFAHTRRQTRGLPCVIGDNPGVSIGDEHSLKRVFQTFAEIARRELMTILPPNVPLLTEKSPPMHRDL